MKYFRYDTEKNPHICMRKKNIAPPSLWRSMAESEAIVWKEKGHWGKDLNKRKETGKKNICLFLSAKMENFNLHSSQCNSEHKSIVTSCQEENRGNYIINNKMNWPLFFPFISFPKFSLFCTFPAELLWLLEFILQH